MDDKSDVISVNLKLEVETEEDSEEVTEVASEEEEEVTVEASEVAEEVSIKIETDRKEISPDLKELRRNFDFCPINL